MLLREHERALFTDRDGILAALHHNAALIQQGEGVNLALVGQRRIGKTMLVQRFADELHERHSLLVPVYFNVGRNLAVPSVFAIRLLASISHSFVEADGRRVEKSSGVLDAASLLTAVDQTREETLVATARRVKREMEKDRPDERMLLETTLSCLEHTAQHTGRTPLVILDEFHNVTQLDSFPQIKDTLSVVGQALSHQTRVSYIAASSHVRMVERAVQSATSPLFDQFQVVPVPPFDQAATAEFCRKRLPEHLLTLATVDRLFEFTFGHPFYLNCLTTAMRRLDVDKAHPWDTTGDDVLDRAIYEEILTQEGRIYQFCEYRVEIALAQARGRATLRSVLLVLAKETRPTLSEIAAQLKRTPGDVSSYLKRLAGFDLTGREGRGYFITDPIIALWIKFIILERTPEYQRYKDAVRRYQDRLAERAA
jgi:AAA+ ATPase superfamily predicted ATPase